MPNKKDWWTPRRRELYGRSGVKDFTKVYTWAKVPPEGKMRVNANSTHLPLDIQNHSPDFQYLIRIEVFDKDGNQVMHFWSKMSDFPDEFVYNPGYPLNPTCRIKMKLMKDVYCPGCGKQTLYKECDDGDYYHGPNQQCMTCGQNFCCIPEHYDKPAFDWLEILKGMIV